MNSPTNPAEPVAQEPGAEGIIEPAAFAPSQAQVARNGRRNLVRAVLATLAVIALLVFWFIFTARSVTFEVGPEPGLVEVVGGFQFQLRGVYLLRSGPYQVSASAPGYEPFTGTVTITDKRNQVHQITLTPLPGLVTIESEPSGANVYLNSEMIGTTPLTDAVIPAGNATIGLQKARYQDAQSSFEVTGKQIQQQVQIDLKPDWSEVTLESEPAGAMIYIDDQPTEVVTPGVVQVLTGEHELKLSLPGYEDFRRRIVAAAEVPMSIGDIKLNRADAQLQVSAQPAGVGIVLNGNFQGQTPLKLALKSGTSYQLRGFKAGYGDVTRNLRLKPGEQRSVALNLKQLIGTLVIRTQPADAQILINGQAQSTADGSDGTATFRLPTRPQRVEVKLPGYAGYSTTITPKAGLSQELRVKLLTEAEARLAALKPRITAANGQELVLLQATAPFKVGASRREPGRRANETLMDITLNRFYYMSIHEVTNAQYRQFTASHDSGSFEEQKLDKDDQPVASVTWLDAAMYCNWLSKKEGLPPFYRIKQGDFEGINAKATGYRLPTEAEWGFAALQATPNEAPLRFPWGARLPPPDRQGNYADRSASNLVGRIIFGYNDNYIASAPVGTYKPNDAGLFDMGGNVSEWIHDFYEIPKVAEQTDPLGPNEGEYHVIKGASWMHGTITDLRLSYRDYGSDGRQDLGFRVARYAEDR